MLWGCDGRLSTYDLHLQPHNNCFDFHERCLLLHIILKRLLSIILHLLLKFNFLEVCDVIFLKLRVMY